MMRSAFAFPLSLSPQRSQRSQFAFTARSGRPKYRALSLKCRLADPAISIHRTVALCVCQLIEGAFPLMERECDPASDGDIRRYAFAFQLLE